VIRKRWRDAKALPALVLGAGIAVCATTFGVARGVLLSDLPYPDAENLVWIGATSPDDATIGITWSSYETLAKVVGPFATAAPYMLASGTLRLGARDNARITVARVGGTFFQMLGLDPIAGRLLSTNDDKADGELVAVISDRLWRSHLSARTDILDHNVLLDERAFRVIGIAPPVNDRWMSEVDVWVAIEPVAGSLLRMTDVPFLSAVARLRRGSVELLASRVSLPVTTGRGARVVVKRLSDHVAGNWRLAVLLLTTGAFLLLGIAVMAATTMQLAASPRRLREIAIRSAVGASPLDLWREALRDGALVGTAASLLGAILGTAALAAGSRFAAPIIPELAAVRVSTPVLLWSSALAVASALFVTVVPLVPLLRVQLAPVLTGSGTSSRTVVRGRSWRDALVALSAGVTLVLVVLSVVTASRLLRLLRTDLGFQASGVIVAQIKFPFHQVTPVESERIRSYARALAVASANVATLALSTDVPTEGSQSIVNLSRSVVAVGSGALQSRMTQVSPDYFTVLRIPMRAGRPFSDGDRHGTKAVAILDERAARALYGAENPLGRAITIADMGWTAEIVGVAASVRQAGRAGSSLPHVYLPFDQIPLSSFALLARAEGELPAFNQQALPAIRSLDATAAVGEAIALDRIVHDELRRPQFFTACMTAFAIFAMMIAAAAISAAVAAILAQERREVGIRLALGATPWAILRLVGARVTLMVGLGSAAAMVGIVALRPVLGGAAWLDAPSARLLAVSTMILWSAASVAVAVPVRASLRRDLRDVLTT